MISHRSTVLLATCITYLGLILGEYHNSELNSAIAVYASSLQVAQVKSEQLPLTKGSQGELVITLQEKLKQLGYYNGLTNGSYSEATELAVLEFQKSVGLEADGIVGSTSWNRLQTAVAEQAKLAAAPNPKPDVEQASSKGRKLFLLLLGVVLLLGAGGGGFFLLRWLTKPKKAVESQFPLAQDEHLRRENSESVWLESNTETLEPTEEFEETEALAHIEPSNLQTGIVDQTGEFEETEAFEPTQTSNLSTEEFEETEALAHIEPSNLQTGIVDQTEALDRTEASNQEYQENGYNFPPIAVPLPNPSNSEQSHSDVNSPHSSSHSSNFPTPLKPQVTGDNLPLEKTTRLAKINIVEELIKDLQQPDPQKRRKAIWELAQQGDSRAVKPLVELMIDSDSQQRTLILEALSQIGNKTLKPLNRALALSLQDDNAQVRKNAIRDLTRIYEVVAQMSQMLCHATDDPDPEVKETARWAMNQLSRIRTPPTFDNLPPSPGSSNLRD